MFLNMDFLTSNNKCTLIKAHHSCLAAYKDNTRKIFHIYCPRKQIPLVPSPQEPHKTEFQFYYI